MPLNIISQPELLTTAVCRGDLARVREMLDHGASASVSGQHGLSPVHWAVQMGHVDVLKLLLARGATANDATNDGLTPLHMAAREGDVDMARALLAAGADADAALAGPSGATALLAAVERGDAALARALLDAGASPDKGGRGSSLHQSPLLLAVARGRTAVAQALLDAGANCGVMVVTKAGGAPESLVDLARARRNFDLLQALTAHEGCDVSWPEGEDVPSTSGEL